MFVIIDKKDYVSLTDIRYYTVTSVLSRIGGLCMIIYVLSHVCFNYLNNYFFKKDLMNEIKIKYEYEYN